jgi:hypothetical protein
MKAYRVAAGLEATSEMGQKRRFDLLPVTSDLLRTTDIIRTGQHVSKVPESDIGRDTTAGASN